MEETLVQKQHKFTQVKAVNDLAEDIQKRFTVPIFVEDFFARVPARGHMVQRTVKFYPQRTSREPVQLTHGCHFSKIQDSESLRHNNLKRTSGN